MWRKILLIVCFVFFSACENQKRTLPSGQENEVIFICDGFPEYKDLLDSLINETYYTPHKTRLFQVIPITYVQFISYRNYKNIVVLSYQNSENIEFYKKIFPSMRTGVFYRKDVFTKNDIVFGVYAETKDSVLQLLKDYAPTIKEKFKENYLNILADKEYFLGVDKKLSQKILKAYGFTFKLSPGWVYKEHTKDFFTMYKHYPDRFIFCFQQEGGRELNPNDFIRIRDSLTSIFYDGDIVLKSTVFIDTVGIRGVPAILTIGAWQNDKMTMGGGFINLAFNYEGKFYMFDYGIFHPDLQDKIEYIMRGYMIFNTVKFGGKDGHR